ncbi:MAG: helix-turn-helix domain-containing protein [Bacteroides sp.]
MDGFGERLRRMRKDLDITQSQLADVIGVVPSAIGKYERIPQSYPSVEALVKIAGYFKVSIDYLLLGVEAAPAVANNINGQLLNSSFVQANNGGVVVNGTASQNHSPEAIELLHIYDALGGRDRLKLLNFAVELEGSTK